MRTVQFTTNKAMGLGASILSRKNEESKCTFPITAEYYSDHGRNHSAIILGTMEPWKDLCEELMDMFEFADLPRSEDCMERAALWDTVR